MKRLRRALGELVPGALCGAFVLLALAAGSPPDESGADASRPDGMNRLAAFLVGGLFGASVLGLLRLFRIAGFGLPFAGLAAGPVPFALLRVPGKQSAEEVGGILVFSAVTGLLIGIVEWARRARAERDARIEDP
jgi:hypothetical protein